MTRLRFMSHLRTVYNVDHFMKACPAALQAACEDVQLKHCAP